MTGIAVFYAENGSEGAGVFQKLNFDDDRWRLMGAAFGTRINYDYYGIGSDSNRYSWPSSQSRGPSAPVPNVEPTSCK